MARFAPLPDDRATWNDRREKWLHGIGRLLGAAELARISPWMRSPAAVRKARREGRLIAFRNGSRYVYPFIQFGPDGAPMPWVREIATALPDADSQLQILAAGRSTDGQSFADRLTSAESASARAVVAQEMVAQARAIADAEAR